MGTALWAGNIPNSILITSSYTKVEFPITALAPYDLLSDGALGVDIDFEIWSLQGTKIASDTIYSFNWNPVSNQNMVSFYIDKDDVVPNAVMRITTEQTVRTNGLIRGYLEDVTQINISLAYGVPPKAPTLSSSGDNYSISTQDSSQVVSFEVHLRYILDNSLSPSARSNYSSPTRVKDVFGRSFTLSDAEIGTYLISQGRQNARYVIISVVAVSEAGTSPHSNGYYLDSSQSAAGLTVARLSIKGPKTVAPNSIATYDIKVMNSKNVGLPSKIPTVLHSGLGQFTQISTSTGSDGQVQVQVSTSGSGEGVFTLNASIDGVSTTIDVQVSTAPKFSVSQKSLALFNGTETLLTNAQKNQVRAAVEANPNAEKFICTGIRFHSQPANVNVMVRKRAKAACDYAKQLNPNLSTWFQNKPTKAASYAGRVLLTIKSPTE